MSPADRAISADDKEIVYRLRKVLLHVKAVTSRQLDAKAIHVLAPELRCQRAIRVSLEEIPPGGIVGVFGA